MDMDKLQYMANTCNLKVLDVLFALKQSCLSDEELKIMLNCVGHTLIKLSFSDKPIEWHIEHIKDFYSQMNGEG